MLKGPLFPSSIYKLKPKITELTGAVGIVQFIEHEFVEELCKFNVGGFGKSMA